MVFCAKKTLILPSLSTTPSLFSFCNIRSKSMSTKCSISELLHETKWMLPDPAASIDKISISNPANYSFSNDPRPILPIRRNAHEEGDVKGSSFHVVRDDLLHPLVNGNKARKLDALIPILQHQSVTDVVICGGCQSAHAAALAVSCAERGIRSHLLLRGEQPEIPTGYNLVSLMYGNVTYVARPMYARREEMLIKHASDLVRSGGCVLRTDDILASAFDGSSMSLGRIVHVPSQVNTQKGLRRVVIVSEGAGDVVALLGLIRLVKYLSQTRVFGKEQEINFVVDAGTGTTAVGLALGALYFRACKIVDATCTTETCNYDRDCRYTKALRSSSVAFKGCSALHRRHSGTIYRY